MLQYLGYIITLLQERLLYAAIFEVAQLAQGSRPLGLYTDVQKTYAKLIPNYPALPPFALLTPDAVNTATLNLHCSMESHLKHALASSHKAYLVDRMSPVNGQVISVLRF